MPRRFQDKVVIVTGSSSGIGRATAALFAEEGAKLTITGRNGNTLENTRDVLLSVGCKLDDILSIRGDLTNEEIQKEIIDKTVAKFGKLDILVNNAGATGPDNSVGEGFEQGIECYDYTMNLNTRTILQLTKLALPHLIKSKGEVIMVSSVAGLDIACPTVSYYAMSKAALDQMTRAMAVKYIADGVRINSVNPGFVRTSIMEKQGVPAQMAENMANKIALDRRCIPAGVAGLPRDIANAIAFLADRSISSYIVGHTLVIDGGTSIMNPLMTASFTDYL